MVILPGGFEQAAVVKEQWEVVKELIGKLGNRQLLEASEDSSKILDSTTLSLFHDMRMKVKQNKQTRNKTGCRIR